MAQRDFAEEASFIDYDASLDRCFYHGFALSPRLSGAFLLQAR